MSIHAHACVGVRICMHVRTYQYTYVRTCTVLLLCLRMYVRMLPFIARSPVFSAMFEHSMEESLKVSPVTQLFTYASMYVRMYVLASNAQISSL